MGQVALCPVATLATAVPRRGDVGHGDGLRAVPGETRRPRLTWCVDRSKRRHSANRSIKLWLAQGTISQIEPG